MPSPDHAEEARKRLNAARHDELRTYSQPRVAALRYEAEIHANLAIAGELRGIKEALEGRVVSKQSDALDKIIVLALDEGERDDNKKVAAAYRIAHEARFGQATSE